MLGLFLVRQDNIECLNNICTIKTCHDTGVEIELIGVRKALYTMLNIVQFSYYKIAVIKKV